jgi:holliday junction DNA helicase RuvA
MFNSLTGTISGGSANSIFLLVNGIEYELACPVSTKDKIGRVGETKRVFTWLLHREDQLALFGFISETERRLFLELIKVDGIGPKQALKILSGIDSEKLTDVIESEDISRLETIPGIGKKTAQKMILTLKGKLIMTESVASELGESEDVVRALTEMGFDKKSVMKALDAILKEQSIGPGQIREREHEIVKEAIVRLSS